VENLYPVVHSFSAGQQEVFSGTVKMNNTFHLPQRLDVQLTGIYLAPDIVPQGRVFARFSLDLGVKKAIQKGKGEVFVNATDFLNTMVVRKEVVGDEFRYVSGEYGETQVVRVGYGFKF
jgi:hypothetical protein